MQAVPTAFNEMDGCMPTAYLWQRLPPLIKLATGPTADEVNELACMQKKKRAGRARLTDQGFFYRPEGSNRQAPVPVYRSGLPVTVR
jgi:hypothetical protein